MMNTLSFDTVSAHDLFENVRQLSAHIDAAKTEAQHVVESGEPIREAHSHGNVNHSLESTCDGAQQVGEDLAARVNLGGQKERIFGEHIREAIAVLRPLWRRK